MADYISREALLEKAWDADTRAGYVQVVDVGDILEAPAADVVEVVRCGNCTSSEPIPENCGFYKGDWQHCSREIFVGLSDSFEAYYQAVRRCWRFGQTRPVDVYIVISEAEGAVKANIERKQADAIRLTQELVKYTKDILQSDVRHTTRITETYFTNERMDIPTWMQPA